MIAVPGRFVGLVLRRALAGLTAGVLLASCGSGRTLSVPPPAASSHFTTPANIALSVPPPPPAMTPHMPSSMQRSTETVATHPAFFQNEALLGNGVYYLQFSNNNYFGYYAYLSDPHYIYHYDMGYEYLFDAADGKSGIYFYDFKSAHFWYTSPQYPFPYLYDFSLNALLYYYPDPNTAGRYNTNGVRYFYNFATGHIISM